MYLLWLLQAIWHWMDNYPEEFTELQKRPNDDLAGVYSNLCILNQCNFLYSAYLTVKYKCCALLVSCYFVQALKFVIVLLL